MTTRVRSKGIPPAYRQVWAQQNGIRYYYRNYPVYPYPLEYTSGADTSSPTSMTCDGRSIISDTFGEQDRYNPVEHTQNLEVSFDVRMGTKTSPTEEYPGGSWMCYRHDVGKLKGTFPFNAFFPSGIPTPSVSSIPWSDLVEDVGSRLDGSMKASSNMLVNMFQLGQTVRMIKNPFGLLRANWRREAKKFSSRQLAKAGANVWLEYRYGWTPFLNDIIAIAKSFKEVSRHREYLTESQGRWSSLSSSQRDESGASSLVGPFNSYYYSVWGELTKYERTARFSIQQYRDFAELKYSEFELLQQRLGVNELLYALWDLVPFSFCVDWIVDVGNYLRQNPMYWDQRNLRRIGYSVKESWEGRLKVESRPSTSYGTDTIVSYSDSVPVLKKYRRVQGFPPDTSTVGLFGGLNLIHLADATAIIAQRL